MKMTALRRIEPGKTKWKQSIPMVCDFWREQWKAVAVAVGGLLLAWHVPLESSRLHNAVYEAVQLVQWYAREHVLLCLFPAFFIAGAVAVFVKSESVMRYLGAGAPKPLAYAVGATSGILLAVCSCTILPLFAGIYRLGAGLGPAVAFLYSGPAVNVLAIILTARVLGPQLGITRALGAVIFSLIIGRLMESIFPDRREESRSVFAESSTNDGRPFYQNAAFFAALVALLIFATWPESAGSALGSRIYRAKWLLTAAAASAVAFMTVRWMKVWAMGMFLAAVPTLSFALLRPDKPTWAFAAGLIGFSLITSLHPGEAGTWFRESWSFTRQILPLLLIGVLVAGALLGRPGHEGLIPSAWITAAVGGNSLPANFLASVAGGLMYFATLTEVPILQGLIGAGMGKGPALALLLAGPTLSLPSMLVIRSILGTARTAVYVCLVIILATCTGYLFGLVVA